MELDVVIEGLWRNPWSVHNGTDEVRATSLECAADDTPPRRSRTGHSATRRQAGEDDDLVLLIKISGAPASPQDGRTTLLEPGAIAVFEGQPLTLDMVGDSEFFHVWLPRRPIETALGPARLYSGLIIPAEHASAGLVRAFFYELARVEPDLDATANDRMRRVGVDLVIASLAERMAQETAGERRYAIALQRAKAYIEEHLSDPDLEARQIAATIGVSLRQLQLLFQDQGRQISDWIWERRLDLARLRLADPGFGHLTISELSYSCGFVSQAHFARRFKARFRMTPREYRQAALR